MELRDWIFHRKSCRSYENRPVEEKAIEQIRLFLQKLRPLYPQIRTQAEIVGRSEVKCICPWTTHQLVALYSETTEGYLENTGFLLQQLDLYLQSIGLGSCWLGMGKMDARVTQTEDGLRFVILLAFGYPKGSPARSGPNDFKRKSLSQISDWEDPRLEPARLAPSSVNSQPWYFVHEGEAIHVYCALRGLVSKTALGSMNRIDIGIALAHLSVCNPETFHFYQTNTAPKVNQHRYIGSFSI